MDTVLATLGKFFITGLGLIAMLVMVGSVLFSVRYLVDFISPSRGASSESVPVTPAPSQPSLISKGRWLV